MKVLKDYQILKIKLKTGEKLFKGDCLELMKQIDDKSIDICRN